MPVAPRWGLLHVPRSHQWLCENSPPSSRKFPQHWWGSHLSLFFGAHFNIILTILTHCLGFGRIHQDWRFLVITLFSDCSPPWLRVADRRFKSSLLSLLSLWHHVPVASPGARTRTFAVLQEKHAGSSGPASICFQCQREKDPLKSPNEIYLAQLDFFSHRQVSPHTVTYQRTRRERALLQISSLLSSEVARGKETNQKRAEMALDAFTQHSCRNSSSCNLRSTTKPYLFCWDPALIDQDHVETRVGIPWAEKSLSPKDCRWNSEPSFTPLSRSGRCWRP